MDALWVSTLEAPVADSRSRSANSYSNDAHRRRTPLQPWRPDLSRLRALSNHWEFWALAALTMAIYFSRLTALPIHGEETRRAEVAIEMVRTGDWIVPRQQNVPLLSRPPLQCWPIALVTKLTGDCPLWATRLPSVLATLLTTLLIYVYGRQFMSKSGALAAGLAYATTGMVLQLGRLAETDAVFTLLVASSLLVWHWGYSSGWRRALPWLAGYGLAALAALAKGPQAPLYFIAATSGYLIWRRDWRTLFSFGHFCGLGLFAAIVAAWQTPFLLALGPAAVGEIWTGDVGMRFEDARLSAIGLHLLFYPVEVLICTLPWSPLLSAFAFRGFRDSVRAVKPWVGFLTICLLVTFPTCWLVPGAKGRYWMPLFPCLALLVGLVIQRALESATAHGVSLPRSSSLLRRGWLAYRATAAAAVLFTGLIVAGATWIERFHLTQLVQPGWFAALFLLASAATFVALLTGGAKISGRMAIVPVLALAGFIGLFHTGVILNAMTERREDCGPAVAALKQKLPPNSRLVSFGLVETLFTYYYGEPIAVQKWPRSERDLDPQADYFCFTWDRDFMPPLPFAWHVEGEVPCDRLHSDHPVKRVIVGKRVASVAVGTMRR